MTSLPTSLLAALPTRPVDRGDVHPRHRAPLPGATGGTRPPVPASLGILGALSGGREGAAKVGMFSASGAYGDTRPLAMSDDAIAKLAQDVGARIANGARPEQRPTRELHRFVDPKTGRSLGGVSRHPTSLDEAGQQIFRALKSTRPGQMPVILNLSERKDHPPGVKHCPDHFPRGVAVPIGPHHSVTRLPESVVSLGVNAAGEPMQARIFPLRVTDSRTRKHQDLKYIDTENFEDGSTPPDASLKKLREQIPKDSPLLVNCEWGIGRSAMMWCSHTLSRDIRDAQKRGKPYTVEALEARYDELAGILHEERGGALLPDRTQNAAVMRQALQELLDPSKAAEAAAA